MPRSDAEPQESRTDESSVEFVPGPLALRVAAIAALIGLVAIGVISLGQSGPTVHPDEWGFLTNGRFLTGQVEAVIPTTSFYPVGFGLVTGLGSLVTGSLQGAYRFTLVVNLVLAMVTAWSCTVMARRIFGTARETAWLAGLLVLVMPGTLLSSVYAWPEIAIRLAFIGLVFMVHRCTTDPGARTVAGLAICAGLLPLLHGRFILLMPVVGASIFWLNRRRLISFVHVAGAAVLMAAGYALSVLLNSWVKHSLYPNSFNQQNRLLRRLVKPDLWSTIARIGAGQTWYLLATTAGLFGLGVLVAIRRARRGSPSGARSGPSHDIFYWTLVAFVVAIVFTGSLQLIGFNRGDHLIYGRYAEVLVPVMVVVAVSALERSARTAMRGWIVAIAMAPVITAVYLAVDGRDVLAEKADAGTVVFPNVPGVDAMHYLVSVRFVSFAIAFFAIGAAAWIVARRSRVAALVALVALFSSGLVLSAERSVKPRTRFLNEIVNTPPILRADGATAVAFDSEIANDPAYYFLRFVIHPVKLLYVRASVSGEKIPDGVNCIYETADLDPPQGKWEMVAEEWAVSRVLWRRVGAARC